ncbi:SulP family inorganic anion transporter [Amnibacterium kyonggiense]|uniref:SulP family sulfate permease n=1 Tax=Amnibacterium kyonggiense TaxID=595671 RepID=A0A4R7FR59_9MICO|nr:SulP family inorganic anion transporter [Amnibacterium kyonggiense]TDS80290.1 SulP family sulfate permease [Amnibacterium kyonggiense]
MPTDLRRLVLDATVGAPERHDSARVIDAVRRPRVLVREVLAGLVVGLALIPEAISFSIVAGVSPSVGLYSSVVMAIVISIVGGRRAMISAATGAIALVVAPVAKEHGLQYLVATVMLAGVLQIVLGAIGFAKLMRFIPRSVMVGFVNSLAILIFIAQLPHLIGVPWAVYPLVALGIAAIVLFPRLTRAVPAPLVAVVLITAIAVFGGVRIPTVGDEGALPNGLPSFLLPQVPLTLETLQIIGPFALAAALVGLIESLMTAKLVDDITETGSNKTRESIGQGIAQITSGLFGGMGGCGMIGQTMINVRESGARTRLSTFSAGVFLLILMVVFHDLVADIPMAALVAVMVMVCVGTFDWHSIRPATLRRMPLGETIVMVATVAVVVATNDLSVGVVVGVLAAMIVFARRVARFASVDRSVDDSGQVRYRVVGELFFASSNDLTHRFDYAGDPDRVIIDLSRSHIWDASTVAALDTVAVRYARHHKTVVIEGMNDASDRFHTRLTGTLAGGE